MGYSAIGGSDARQHQREMPLGFLAGLLVQIAAGLNIGLAAADDMPNNIQLADGTTVPMEQWGDTYSAVEHQAPIDHKTFKPIAKFTDQVFSSIELDPHGRKIYWLDKLGSVKSGCLRRANLDGTMQETLIKGLDDPRGLCLDSKAKKLYWLEMGRNIGIRKGIRRSNLDGSGVEDFIVGLDACSGMQLDASEGKIYWQNGYSIYSANLDATDEKRLLTMKSSDGMPFGLALDSKSHELVWSVSGQGFASGFWTSNRDGTACRRTMWFPFFSLSFARGIEIDAKSRKVYWASSHYGSIRRANLDGSECELLVDGVLSPVDVAIDSVANKIYFAKNDGSAGRMLYQADLPPLRKRKSISAPPMIAGIEPLSGRAGERITIFGTGFNRTTQVAFINDSTGEHIPAKFSIVSTKQVDVVVPRLSDGCSNPSIVVLAEGGVTVTLPTDIKTVNDLQRHDRYVEKPTRFLVNGRPGKELKDQGRLISAEKCLSYVEPAGTAVMGPRGNNTIFVKNEGVMIFSGSRPNTIYHEPFAIISHQYDRAEGNTVVPVPAIRPSFLKELFEYRR